mmetsp:Transcript_41568/g.134286  ORF Transcript_41568/g.134286 Transcript_41568/m.134286 type:complete len:325 (-) Transcript_41568:333-1307(-)
MRGGLHEARRGWSSRGTEGKGVQLASRSRRRLKAARRRHRGPSGRRNRAWARAGVGAALGGGRAEDGGEGEGRGVGVISRAAESALLSVAAAGEGQAAPRGRGRGRRRHVGLRAGSSFRGRRLPGRSRHAEPLPGAVYACGAVAVGAHEISHRGSGTLGGAGAAAAWRTGSQRSKLLSDSVDIHADVFQGPSRPVLIHQAAETIHHSIIAPHAAHTNDPLDQRPANWQCEASLPLHAQVDDRRCRVLLAPQLCFATRQVAPRDENPLEGVEGGWRSRAASIELWEQRLSSLCSLLASRYCLHHTSRLLEILDWYSRAAQHAAAQ